MGEPNVRATCHGEGAHSATAPTSGNPTERMVSSSAGARSELRRWPGLTLSHGGWPKRGAGSASTLVSHRSPPSGRVHRPEGVRSPGEGEATRLDAEKLGTFGGAGRDLPEPTGKLIPRVTNPRVVYVPGRWLPEPDWVGLGCQRRDPATGGRAIARSRWATAAPPPERALSRPRFVRLGRAPAARGSNLQEAATPGVRHSPSRLREVPRWAD